MRLREGGPLAAEGSDSCQFFLPKTRPLAGEGTDGEILLIKVWEDEAEGTDEVLFLKLSDFQPAIS